MAFLLHERRLTIQTVDNALRRREKLIGEIRDRMDTLGADAVNLISRAAKDGPFPMAAKVAWKAGPRKERVSAGLRKRQAQGRYPARSAKYQGATGKD